MQALATANRQARFSNWSKAPQTMAPQEITAHGRPAVVISRELFDRLQRQTVVAGGLHAPVPAASIGSDHVRARYQPAAQGGLVSYLIDTNVLSELRRKQPDPQVVAWMQAGRASPLYLSVLDTGRNPQGGWSAWKTPPANKPY